MPCRIRPDEGQGALYRDHMHQNLRQGAAIMGRDLRVDGAISLAWRSPESGGWLPYLDFTAEQVVVDDLGVLRDADTPEDVLRHSA